MTPSPHDMPLTTRLGARVGPEIVASILVVAVLFVAVVVALSGQRGSVATAGSPEPSVAAVVPSASAEAPTATAVPSGTTPASASPTASATPIPPSAPPASTPRPAQVAAALAVRELVDRLLGQRADLVTELAKTTTDSNAIADLLRDVNASIVRMDEPLADLAAEPSSADLASRIRAVNSTTSQTVSRIQHTSPRNAKTYRDGATEVVADLESLPGLRSELAAFAG